MNEVNNKELHDIFKKLSNKDEIGYNVFYEKYNKLVYSIAFSILKNKQDSEEIVQKVFIKIWRVEKEKLPTRNEASWLYSVTKNEVLNFLKNRKGEVSMEELYYVSSEDKELNDIIEKETFNKIIEKLPMEEQEIISLKILSNLSFMDISKILNVPIGTIKWKYYKTINTLKALLQGLGTIIIAFIITGKTLSKNKKNNNNIENKGLENQIEETEKKDTYEEILNNYLKEEQTTENTIQQQVNNEQINCYIGKKITIFAIFFILMIIFIIFFKKYQPKFKKKMSK